MKIESKEKFTKLLAMEDLDIQHRQVKTAMFDVKNRTLTLPIWKDMSNHVYDLLAGHEVGHALYTPKEENVLKGLIEKTSKHIVNVVEDARIESLMKRKYPGLIKQFYKGYQTLLEKDFFGLSKVDIENINFLDKINLYFKVPGAINGIVEFTEIEQKFINKIETITKFSEVKKVCKELYKYLKEEKEKEESSLNDFDELFDELNDSSDGLEDEENESYSDSSDSNETEEQKEMGEDKDETDEDESESNENQEIDSDENQEQGDDEITSETYENFENQLSKQYVDDITADNTYANIPDKINYNNIIDYKKVHSDINKFYNPEFFNKVVEEKKPLYYIRSYSDFINYNTYGSNSKTLQEQFEEFSKSVYKQAKETLSEIKRKSIKNVNHMAMEFERKKCADIYKKVCISKTGILDTNKLFSAKYNEDVFKKNVRIPDGKNHGLVMFIDWSGSMAPHLKGCVKQLIEFVLFCKKVNIPFEVYSFTDYTAFNNNLEDIESRSSSFEYKVDDCIIDKNVTIRNYLSSRMNVKELNNALINLCIISNAYGYYQNYVVPLKDCLYGTPLAGAILLSEHIINEFKTRNNLQEVHSVWITDGEGNNCFERKMPEEYNSSESFTESRAKFGSPFPNIIKDKKTKKSYSNITRRATAGNNCLSSICFDVVKSRTNCNIIGFFLASKYGQKFEMTQHYFSGVDPVKNPDISKWIQQAKKDGHFVKSSIGYDEFYVIDNSPKRLDKPEVEIEEEMTTRKMVSAFSSNNTQFKNSRIILSRFIDLITNNL